MYRRIAFAATPSWWWSWPGPGSDGRQVAHRCDRARFAIAPAVASRLLGYGLWLCIKVVITSWGRGRAWTASRLEAG
jgi:hypothetical protein